jgi:hypothetical protein
VKYLLDTCALSDYASARHRPSMFPPVRGLAPPRRGRGRIGFLGKRAAEAALMRNDVVVLGAGIVGICVALHVQKRSRSAVLVDRRGAAEETSFGNAGLYLP